MKRAMSILLACILMLAWCTLGEETEPLQLRIFVYDRCGGCGADGPGCGNCDEIGRLHGIVKETLGDRLTVTHVHDNNGLDDEHLFPYMGITDWDRFCRALGETGYDGPLSFETFNALNTFDTALAPQLMSLLGATADLLAGRIEGARKGDMA